MIHMRAGPAVAGQRRLTAGRTIRYAAGPQNGLPTNQNLDRIGVIKVRRFRAPYSKQSELPRYRKGEDRRLFRDPRLAARRPGAAAPRALPAARRVVKGANVIPFRRPEEPPDPYGSRSAPLRDMPPTRRAAMGGCGGTSAPGPLVSNDRTLPMLIATSGECHTRTWLKSARPGDQRDADCLARTAARI